MNAGLCQEEVTGPPQVPPPRVLDALPEIPDVVHFVEVDDFASAHTREGDEFCFRCVQAKHGFALENGAELGIHVRDPPSAR